MLIKKYIGTNLGEIQDRIIRDFGPFSIILFTKIIDKGFFSWLFTGNQYEISVGIEPEKYAQYLKASPEEMEQMEKQMLTGGVKDLDQIKSKILVSGAIPFISTQKNIVYLVGPYEFGRVVVATKLYLKLTRDTPYKVGIITLGELNSKNTEQINSFIQIFRLPYHNCKNEQEYQNIISKSDCDVFIVIVSSQFEHVTQTQLGSINKLLVVDGNESVAEQIEQISKYKSLGLFGLVYMQFESKPNFRFLNEIFEKESVPITYLMESSEIKLANADDLDTRIINEKLVNLSTWLSSIDSSPKPLE